MKLIFFLILTTHCIAEQYVFGLVRLQDSAITTISIGSSDPTTTRFPPPPANFSWQAFPLSQWTATAQDIGDGVPVLTVSGGRAVARVGADIAVERAALAVPKISAAKIQLQIQLDAATKLSNAYPADTDMANQVVKLTAALAALTQSK